MPAFALLVSVMAQAAPVADELCVWAERDERSWNERPALDDGRGWPALRRALRLAHPRPRPLDAPAVVGGFAWDLPAPPAGAPLGVRVEVAAHPDDPGRTLVWIGARATAAPPSHTPRDVLALVDLSPSMESVLPGWRPGDAVRTRHDLAVVAVEALRAELGPHDRLGVVGFMRGAEVLAPPERGGRAAAAAARDPDREGARRWTADPVTLALGLEGEEPCVERHYLVLSDGPGFLGEEPEAARAALAASAIRGASWSAITLAASDEALRELDGVAWLGHGRHERAETPREVRAAVRDAFGSRPTVARDVEWGVHVNAPRRVVLSEAVPAVVPSDATWTALYDVSDPAPRVSVRWSAGSPIPDEWTREGEVAPAPGAVPFRDASSDLRMAWVLSELMRWSRGDGVDLDRLAETASDAARPGNASHQELVRLLERATASTGGSVHAP